MYFKDKTYYVNKVKECLGLILSAFLVDAVIILCLFF